MPAPDFATLYDFETQIEGAVVSAIVAFLAQAGITAQVERSQSSDTESTPRVEVNFTPGNALSQRTTIGQAVPKQVPNAFEGSLSIRVVTTRPIPTDNADLHGPIRGWGRYVLSAEAKAFTTAILPYLQILEMLPAGSASQLYDEKQQDITELTFNVWFCVRNEAWPPEIVPPSGILVFPILISGQSLGVGMNGVPVVSTTQTEGNLMFTGGVRSADDELGTLIPLIAQQQPVAGADEDGGETIANGMADQLAVAFPNTKYLVSDNALNGAQYNEIKQGTAPYALGIAQAIAAFNLISASANTFGRFLAVTLLHGEQDQAFGNTGYALDLAELQDDENTDLKAISGQSEDIPLFVYQQCASAPSQASPLGAATALESLKAHEDDPGKVILVGPNYPFIRSDGIHLTANGYRSLGLNYFEAMKVVQAGGTWNPLRPILIVRTNAFIDITFLVPVPPITFDLARVFNPGHYGFSFTDDDSSAAVSSVAITGATTVRVTLNATPTGANKFIRYGWTGSNWAGGPGPAGPLGSARGNLRDAGYTGNPYGYDCFNWGVLFNKPVT